MGESYRFFVKSSALLTFWFCLFSGHQIAWAGSPQIFHLDFTRDTIVSSVQGEQIGNCGKNRLLKLKSQQEMVIFDVEPLVLKGQLLSSATFHVRSKSPDTAPLGRVTVSSLASPWVEGRSSRYSPEKGASCFSQSRFKKQDWAYPRGNLLDVTLGHGNTKWAFSDCTQPDSDGWQSCLIDPEIVSLRVAGVSYGFAMYDDIGTTWSISSGKYIENIFPNRIFYSRESRKNKPFLKITLGGMDSEPPLPVSHLSAVSKGYPKGEAILSWVTPEDLGGGETVGFHVEYRRSGGNSISIPRYLVPLAGQEGERVYLTIKDIPFNSSEQIDIFIRPVDSAGNVGEVYQQKILLGAGADEVRVSQSDISPFALTTTLPKVKDLQVAVVDILDKIDPVSGRMIPKQKKGYKGGNHIFSAPHKLVRLQAARNETVAFQLNLEGKSKDISVTLFFDDTPGIETSIHRFSYVKLDKKQSSPIDFLPDPLLPLIGSFNVPSNSGNFKISKQNNVSLGCEVYIPHTTIPGKKHGKLIIRSGDESLELNVEMRVWPFTLPNKLSFIPEMNAYSTTSPYKGYDYYRLAHKHRTCLNRLPYDWSGNPSFAPKWDGDDFNWVEWDQKVGPLLDGTAFIDMPRKGEPVDVMYLPFNENWPVNLLPYYHPSYWADDAFDSEYTRQLSNAFSDFVRHTDDKGWGDTIFQFYLNNKIKYKKKRFSSSAPWVLDEPVDTKDFWALRWYGILFQNAISGMRGQEQYWYRGDISYSQFSRNILWGVTDIEYLGGNSEQKTRMKREEISITGGAFAEYGNANKITESNVQPVLWCLSAWAKGAIGVLPWQTIGQPGSWKTADQNALFYPTENGPVPSVRLKAFTRGQQDIEYLTLLADTFNYQQEDVAKFVKNELGGLNSVIYKANERDAGESKFADISPVALWKLRTMIAEKISEKAPLYKRSLRKMSKRRNSSSWISDTFTVPGDVSVSPIVPECDSFLED